MGNLTAPAIFALQSSSAEELEGLIEGEFQEEGSLQHAVKLVHESGGIAAARKLARQEADMVITLPAYFFLHFLSVQANGLIS